MTSNVEELGNPEEPRFAEQVKDTLEELKEQITGNFRTSASGRSDQWLPKIEGSTTKGEPVYSAQEGFTYRQNQLVDCWFDLQWTGHTGVGNLQLVLPSLVAKASKEPFVGIIEATGITYAGDYLTINAQADSYYALLRICNPASSSTTVTFATAGADGGIRGHIRYIGQLFV